MPLSAPETSQSQQNQLNNRLQTLAQQNANQLQQRVAQIILEADDPATFIQDVLTHGCISGIVSELIYYTDTHRFYDRYYDEIEILREALETAVGEPVRIDGDLKNTFAWFGFEETTRRIAEQVEL